MKSKLILCLLLTLPAVARAQFNFKTNNGTITITGYTGGGGAVVIPGKISGMPVTSIGDWAFWGCTNLADLTIPNTVSKIGDDAFVWCTSLTNLTMGDSVASIGRFALWQCSGLTGVTIPNSVTNIGGWAFKNCTNLKGVCFKGN